MKQNLENDSEERTVQMLRKILFGLGGVFVLVGFTRQWPVLGKTYLEFIEGKGYMTLILGLIMIVLGFSVRLLVGENEDPS